MTTIVWPDGKQSRLLLSSLSSVSSMTRATAPRGSGPACGTVKRGPTAGTRKYPT